MKNLINKIKKEFKTFTCPHNYKFISSKKEYYDVGIYVRHCTVSKYKCDKCGYEYTKREEWHDE